MYDPNDHVVHCVNGCLNEGNANATTTRNDIRRLVSQALAVGPKPELVIHMHGGLVDKAAAYGIAERLSADYDQGSRYSIFLAWESGLIEAIRNNLADISQDKLFQQMVKRAVWWVLKQVPAGIGLKGAGGAVSRDTYNREFDDYFKGTRGPLPNALQGATQAEVTLRGAASPLNLDAPGATAGLETKIQTEIAFDVQTDFAFSQQLTELHSQISNAGAANLSRKSSGIGTLVIPSTEIDPNQAGNLFTSAPGAKGVFSVASIAWFLAKLVVRVLKRLLSGRGHGIYTTVVEEILAGLYLDKVGGVVWQQMKKDTLDAFQSPQTTAGAALLEEIQLQQSQGKRFKRITLVGHSTGAVFICNLLNAAATLLPDQKFGVIFLAPAVTYDLFAATLNKHASRIDGFRRFGMSDDVEVEDVLVPIIYLRSLLYLVSGVLEFTEIADPERVPDTPLVGMQRYGHDKHTYDDNDFPNIQSADAYIGKSAQGSVWSVTADGTVNGLASQSRNHGDFDDDPITIASVVQILSHGF